MTPVLNEPWLARTRVRAPLVHHVTNMVTINDCANMTLCVGASPVMSDSREEADQLTAIASALVLNMGTLNPPQVEAMMAAGVAARSLGLPVVFDPVGAGATPYRQATARRIMDEVRPTIVKGNLAEIKFLVGLASDQKGVDSLDNAGAPEAVLALSRAYGCVAAATGAVDYVSDGQGVWAVDGGRPELGRVTGTGCMTASLIGSVAGAGADGLTAALLGILIMDRAGEISGAAFDRGLGMGHFRTGLFDAVGALTDAELLAEQRVRRVGA